GKHGARARARSTRLFSSSPTKGSSRPTIRMARRCRASPRPVERQPKNWLRRRLPRGTRRPAMPARVHPACATQSTICSWPPSRWRWLAATHSGSAPPSCSTRRGARSTHCSPPTKRDGEGRRGRTRRKLRCAHGATLSGGQVSAVRYDVTYEEQRNRLTVAFRFILAIPHLIVSQVWGYLAQIVGVIQWFIIVFTGKRNEGLWNLQQSWLGYYSRVVGYMSLLYDPYPAFGTDPGNAPVRTEISYEESANRLTTGLRFLWIIPAAIVAIFVG